MLLTKPSALLLGSTFSSLHSWMALRLHPKTAFLIIVITIICCLPPPIQGFPLPFDHLQTRALPCLFLLQEPPHCVSSSPGPVRTLQLPVKGTKKPWKGRDALKIPYEVVQYKVTHKNAEYLSHNLGADLDLKLVA